MLLDFVITSVALAFFAWICAYASRPFFKSRWSRISSQTVAVFLLLICSVISSVLKQDIGDDVEILTDDQFEILIYIIIFIVALKSAAMYLISCYAKSVNKSPSWSFVGILTAPLALVFLVGSLWKDKKVFDDTKVDAEAVERAQKQMDEDPNVIRARKKIEDIRRKMSR